MYIKHPRYYRSFKCIGSGCPDNCCYGWNIFWDKAEIDKVLNAENISPELRELVKKSFVSTENKENDFKIEFGQDAVCPFQTDDKLCKIQKELGAEYLSYVCSYYPRIITYVNDDTYYCSCHMSCPMITDKLLNDSRSTDLVSEPGVLPYKIVLSSDPHLIDKHPEQKYRAEIFEFLYELIADKHIELERALMLGAIAAERLAKVVGREDYESIPDEIKNLRKELRNNETLKVVNNVMPNLRAKLSVLPMITEQIVGNTITYMLHDDQGNIKLEIYNRGEERMIEALKERKYFFRNVALNLLFELDVPFKMCERSIFENYGFFMVAFACIKLNIIAALGADEPITMEFGRQIENVDERITAFTAQICRKLCQNSEKPNQVITELNAHGFINHAYLAAFVL